MLSRPIRFSLLLLSALLVTDSSSAARRRPISYQPAPAANCHTFKLVKAGLKADYQTTAPSGNATFTVTYISDTATRTVTKQRTTTSQGVTDTDTQLDAEIVGNLRNLKHITTKTVAQVPVLGTITIDVDIDFVPSLTAGPSGGWCQGATWDQPPVTETITSRSQAGQTTNVITTVASTGSVLAVGENVTVPAGTFKTVKYKSSLVSSGAPQPAITWASMDHAIVVRQDTLDANGNVSSTTVLTGLSGQ